MSKVKSVRVGLVGCGIIAQWQHLPALSHIGEAEIAAICDRDRSLLASVGKKFKIAKCYDDLGEMLSKEKLDVLDICTPPQTHAALSIKAAESGCHILVEKPAGLTLEEFGRMAEACARNKVKLCQVHNMMYEPVMLRAISQVKSGDIGTVMGVEIRVLSRRTAELSKDPKHWIRGLPAGVFSEGLPHPIYLAQAFLGAVEPVAVHVRDISRHRNVASDEIWVVLEGEGGTGVITYSGNSPKDKMIMNVHGTSKSLRIDLWNSVKTEYAIGGTSLYGRAMENLKQSFSILTCSAGTALDVVTGRFHSGHFNIIRGFIQSVRNGTEMPVTIEQAREVIRVLEIITRLVQVKPGP